MKNWIILVLILGSLNTSCKKEKNMPHDEGVVFNCITYPPSADALGYQWSFAGGFHYSFPQAYLQNQQIYFRFNSEVANSQKFEVVSLNNVTKEIKVLAKDVKILDYLSANPDGNIFFNDGQTGLYLYSKGVVSKMPDFSASSYPSWLPDGNYGYLRDSTYYIRDVNHVIKDSIIGLKYSFKKMDVNPDNIGIFASNSNLNTEGIYTFNIHTNTFTLVKSLNHSDEKLAIKNVKWHTNGKVFYYVDGYGLSKQDIVTGSEKQLYPNCDNISFEDISISPDGSLYVQAYQFERVDSLVLNVHSRIYKMTDEGKNLELIF